MKLTFLGATQTVTGSKYLLSFNSKNILIDCGLFQGYKELRLRNWRQLPIKPEKIDFLILTHAHIDHSGYIPLLVKNGFKGKIFCTMGTKDLCAILLPDSGHIQEEDAYRANKYGYSKHTPALPLYTREDAIQSLDQFYPVDYNHPLELFNNFKVSFLPAGHIIGSSIVKIEADNKIVVFTGDLGRPHHPIMRTPSIITETDYLITESTYGDRLHETEPPASQLEKIINETIIDNGSVIIPSFAVGRSQDILYYLYHLKLKNKIPDVPIYLDSPMAQNVSDLLARYAFEHRLTKEDSVNICKIAHYTKTTEASKAIDQSASPKIIISASGMAEGGRILHHLKAYLPDYHNTILFTGYQAPGTRGDRLLRGEKEIKIHGEMVPVKARISQILSLSAHSDYNEMLDWFAHFTKKPKKVFITHGNQESALSLKKKIEEKFHWHCYIPEYLDEILL